VNKSEEDEMKAIPYYDRLMETLSPLNPKPMKTYREYDLTELERIETEMMIHDMHCFEADKLEKIVTIRGDIMGGKLVICATNILPSDEYPLPIFTSEVIQAVNHVGLRADFMPLADLALDMGYFNKYMMPMEEIWKRSKDLEGAGPERHHWARALTSPFYAYGKFQYDDTIEDTSLDITIEYLKVYVKLWSEAEKGDPAYMAPLNKRKNAILDTYRKWDPGRGPLETTVGKEKAHQIMDILF
jgi:hypothetical protein